jgi:beta-lactamase regulating signal transducer with metallopeptidase domain
MILLWMLVASAVAAAAGMAALALDSAARALGRPTRLSWVAALTFSTVWAARLLLQPAAPRHSDGAVVGVAGLVPVLVIAGRDAIAAAADHLSAINAPVSLILVAAWVLVTTALLARLVLGTWSLHRQRSTWEARELDGMPVLIAPATGPAVVGVRRPAVVLPEWALSLDPLLRQIVLRHESEHVRARDAVLRLLGALLPALMPWNVALWWQADRLALAIEVDCDARVLRSDARRERYGLLLLAIAQRQSTAMLAPALSEPISHLERRIIAMQRSTPHRPVLVAAGLTVTAAIFLVLACSAPSPNVPVAPPADQAAPNASTPVPTRTADQGHQYFDFQVDKQAAAYPDNPRPLYPDILQTAGVAGEVFTQFVIDETGHVDMSTFKVIRSDNDLFTASIRSALPMMHFHPAEVAGRPVKELVQEPFAFAMR